MYVDIRLGFESKRSYFILRQLTVRLKGCVRIADPGLTVDLLLQSPLYTQHNGIVVVIDEFKMEIGK